MEPLRLPTNKIELRTRAFNIIKERSFRRGSFVLVSGRTSNFYLDMKPSMFDPEGANLLAQLVLDRVQDLKVDLIGGLEMGAVPLVTAVSVVSACSGAGRPLPGFFVRKAVKDHGTRRRIEAAGDLRGKRVVILDDVTTTGGSAMEAVEAVQKEGAEVVLVLAIVDREEGAADFYREKGIPFDCLFRVREFLAAT